VKLADEKGLFLQINPNGTKYWRQKYHFDGRENCLPAGSILTSTVAAASLVAKVAISSSSVCHENHANGSQ